MESSHHWRCVRLCRVMGTRHRSVWNNFVVCWLWVCLTRSGLFKGCWSSTLATLWPALIKSLYRPTRGRVCLDMVLSRTCLWASDRRAAPARAQSDGRNSWRLRARPCIGWRFPHITNAGAVTLRPVWSRFRSIRHHLGHVAWRRTWVNWGWLQVAPPILALMLLLVTASSVVDAVPCIPFLFILLYFMSSELRLGSVRVRLGELN